MLDIAAVPGAGELDPAAVAASVGLDAYSSTFSSHFPLPFRILVLVSFGILCWAMNLHVLHILGIDTGAILDIRSDTTGQHVHPSKLYPGVYQLAAFYAAWTALCWVLGFQFIAGGVGDAPVGRLVSGLSIAAALAFLVLPLDKIKQHERKLFLRSLRRTVLEGIFRPVPFCDVILADILTSFAKVGGDVWVCLCSIVFAEDDVLSRGTSIRDVGVPVMIALPYVFRFRQCMAEYIMTPAVSPAQAPHVYGHGHAPSIFLAPTSASSTPASPKKRALFNACKYASAFPVIFFSALQGKFGDPHDHDGGAEQAESASFLSSTALFRIWVLSVLVNSLFSFWWDITNDWGLHLLLPSRLAGAHGGGSGTVLRRILLLPDTTIYYLIIALDFILRFTWSLKLSSHLHSIHEIEMGIFTLEFLEVTRRWIWVYVRVEWEAVRKGGDSLEDRLRGTGIGMSGMQQPSHSASDVNLPLLATPAGGVPQSPPRQHQSSIGQHDSPGGKHVGGAGGNGLDRRVSSASQRKPSGKTFTPDTKSSPAFAANGYASSGSVPDRSLFDDSSSSNSDFGLGRSGVLIDLPDRR